MVKASDKKKQEKQLVVDLECSKKHLPVHKVLFAHKSIKYAHTCPSSSVLQEQPPMEECDWLETSLGHHKQKSNKYKYCYTLPSWRCEQNLDVSRVHDVNVHFYY